MIERSRFDLIRERHGSYASWAIWASAGNTPKSNICDLSVLDPEANSALLNTIHNDVVMVGLNISRFLSESFRNFHDPNPHSQDYKIRYAFENTRWWGAYMTDIIKGIEIVKSADLLKLLTPDLIKTNINLFLSELYDLGSTKPILLAFGIHVYQIIANYVPPGAYRQLVKITHYSHYINKEKYRETVLRQIDSFPMTNTMP